MMTCSSSSYEQQRGSSLRSTKSECSRCSRERKNSDASATSAGGRKSSGAGRERRSVGGGSSGKACYSHHSCHHKESRHNRRRKQLQQQRSAGGLDCDRGSATNLDEASKSFGIHHHHVDKTTAATHSSSCSRSSHPKEQQQDNKDDLWQRQSSLKEPPPGLNGRLHNDVQRPITQSSPVVSETSSTVPDTTDIVKKASILSDSYSETTFPFIADAPDTPGVHTDQSNSNKPGRVCVSCSSVDCDNSSSCPALETTMHHHPAGSNSSGAALIGNCVSSSSNSSLLGTTNSDSQRCATTDSESPRLLGRAEAVDNHSHIVDTSSSSSGRQSQKCKHSDDLTQRLCGGEGSERIVVAAGEVDDSSSSAVVLASVSQHSEQSGGCSLPPTSSHSDTEQFLLKGNFTPDLKNESSSGTANSAGDLARCFTTNESPVEAASVGASAKNYLRQSTGGILETLSASKQTGSEGVYTAIPTSDVSDVQNVGTCTASSVGGCDSSLMGGIAAQCADVEVCTTLKKSFNSSEEAADCGALTLDDDESSKSSSKTGDKIKVQEKEKRMLFKSKWWKNKKNKKEMHTITTDELVISQEDEQKRMLDVEESAAKKNPTWSSQDDNTVRKLLPSSLSSHLDRLLPRQLKKRDEHRVYHEQLPNNIAAKHIDTKVSTTKPTNSIA